VPLNIVVAAGDNCIDYYENLGRRYPTGNAVDVAVHLARLGVKTSLVSVTGSDDYGTEVVNLLQSNRVDTSHLQRQVGITAVTEMQLVHNDRVHVQYREGVLRDFKPTEEQLQFTRTHRMVHTSIWGKMNSYLADFKSSGLTVVYDFSTKLDYPELESLLPDIDYAFFSYREEDPFIQDFMRKAQSLGPKVVVVTLGEHGSVAYDGIRFYRCEALPVDVINTVGAGDSFIAGYMYGLLREESIQECLKRGSYLASTVVTKFEPY
jgi:fructoselysine 6-kinase